MQSFAPSLATQTLAQSEPDFRHCSSTVLPFYYIAPPTPLSHHKVVFYDKQFRVRNELIAGTIKYQDDELGSNLRNATAYDFVSFARTADGVRIGRINVGADGQYTLNLRSEYHFNWYTDEIVFNHIDDSGNVYQVKLASLAELYANRDVVLTKR